MDNLTKYRVKEIVRDETWHYGCMLTILAAFSIFNISIITAALEIIRPGVMIEAVKLALPFLFK
jgi:hypothetical protein